MRVAVYHNNNDLRIEERPRPSLGPGELLLRVEASGICGSDLMEWYRVPRAPLVLGHEVAGTIEAVGGLSRARAEYRPGDRIVTTHHVPCGECRYCLSDRASVCETLRTTSFDPGGFAEYVRVPALNVELGTFRLPDHVSAEEGSFVEPLACVVRAQRLAGIGPGDRVAVLGAGISGLLHVQLARASGVECIVATDVHEGRLDAARRFGADAAVDARGDVACELQRCCGGLADRVIVCTGALSALEQALALVDRGGTVLFFAPPLPDERLSLAVTDLWQRGVTILHSYAGPPAEMRIALDLIDAGRIDVASMVTHRLPLERTGEGFELVARGADSLKVVIRPHG